MEKTINRLTNFLNTIPKFVIMMLALILTLIIGLLDYLIDFIIGSETSITIVYLLPIFLTAWYIGRLSSIFISIVSVTVWIMDELITGNYFKSTFNHSFDYFMVFGLYIVIIYLVTFLKKEFEKEKEFAVTDFLTGVRNGRYFYEHANIEISRAKRYDRPITLAYIDLDNFKKVNDNYGHSIGDKLLATTAMTIKNNIRSIDIIARLGGDEFIILMPETDCNQAKIVVSKIKKYVERYLNKKKWSVTLSIGVVTCINPSCDLDELIKVADKTMYQVKKRGKNTIKYKQM